MHRLLILLVLLLLLPGCGNDKGQKPIASQRNGATQGRTQLKPSGPNWAAMMRKVSNSKSRQDKILELMSAAVSEHAQYKLSVKRGSPDTSRLKKAQELKENAGTLYDELQMDVFEAAGNDDLGEQLWDQRLSMFQRRYDGFAKKVRRIEYK